MLLVANRMMQKNWNMNEALAHGYSFESTQQVQHDIAGMGFSFFKLIKNTEMWLKPCHMGTHLRVLNKCYPRTTNITVSV